MIRLQTLLRNQTFLVLLSIFILAVIIRFLYFPSNIYFGFDQARDAFISQEILEGKLKIVGPTTSIPGLSHGALFYYMFAPIYLISQSDPTELSIFLRIYNALGIFLIFFIGRSLFSARSSSGGKWVGLIAAVLYAFSYEQTQYALFMTHPALAVISVLTFYLGLTLLLFKHRSYGLPLTLLGLGLSFQFHFLLAYLGLIFVLCMAIFWRRIPKLNLKVILTSTFCLLFTLSTFIIAEVRFGFAGVKTFTNSLANYSQGANETPGGGIAGALIAAQRYAQDNIFYYPGFSLILLAILFLGCLYFLRQKENRDQIIFLLIWFIIGLFSYFINQTELYFYGVGTSLSLLVLVSFFISQIYLKLKIAAIILTIVILVSNIILMMQHNPTGPNTQINVQKGMLLSDEKKVMDYIYSKAQGQPFAVNAYSMPLYINTTWAYLFEWYGQKEYGYLPVWGGSAADGYLGNLVINNSRTTLPEKRFLILEPIRGFEHLVKDFRIEEGWFTDIIEEKQFGAITVNFQKPK